MSDQNSAMADELLEAHTIDDEAQPGQPPALKCSCGWTGTSLDEGGQHARDNGLCGECWGSGETADFLSPDDSGIGPCPACNGRGTAAAEDANARAAEEFDRLMADTGADEELDRLTADAEDAQACRD
ncbi:hypothetical protein GCM10023196_036300 [Actinoallomurus vinaceus]|uniref:Molecular chaperone DnaJ n=1 Tax=Actinoallomurus vinaceus TaxID=1080074 RepID=A0ABP8UAP2_9ACTN